MALDLPKLKLMEDGETGVLGHLATLTVEKQEPGAVMIQVHCLEVLTVLVTILRQQLTSALEMIVVQVQSEHL